MMILSHGGPVVIHGGSMSLFVSWLSMFCGERKVPEEAAPHEACWDEVQGDVEPPCVIVGLLWLNNTVGVLF